MPSVVHTACQVVRFEGPKSTQPGRFMGVLTKTAPHPFDVVHHRGEVIVATHTGTQVRSLVRVGRPMLRRAAVPSLWPVQGGYETRHINSIATSACKGAFTCDIPGPSHAWNVIT